MPRYAADKHSHAIPLQTKRNHSSRARPNIVKAADGNGIGFWVISDVELCRDYHCLTMETYKRHFKAAHGDSHLCALCDNQSFVDTETFQTHCNVEHPPMTHRCDMCPEGFDNAYTFALHHLFKSAVHPKCSMCRVGFETKDGLLQHPQDIHEAVPVEKLDLERADEVFSILTVWLLCSLHVMLPAATHDYAICGICGAAAICFIIPVCDLTKITVINVDPRGPSWIAESSSPSEAWTHGSEVSPRLALTPMSEVSMLFSETPGCFYPDYPAPLRPSPPEPLAVKTSKNEDGALTPIDAALVRERDILAGEVISILSDELETSEPVFTPQEATPIIGSPPRPASPQITRNRESGSTSQTLAKVPLTSDCFSSPVAVTNPDMISPLTESFSSSTSLLRSPSPIVEPIEQDSFRMPVLEASPAPEGFPGAIPGMFRILPPIDHQLATERVPSPTLRPRFREMGSEAKSKNSCVSQSWAPMFLASPCSEALELDNNTDVRLPNREYLSEQPLQSSVSHLHRRSTHCRRELRMRRMQEADTIAFGRNDPLNRQHAHREPSILPLVR
ncbi:hypothetical protein POSPLADRAFT_1139758 [Postia placenta MAD-698-R-SB12]|uniref:C2H2-type domain-containing protein n=1 Tax=Postia placenta MAD-698-R-SB12 TaxID=670580 RepID=A0A1X6N507_9APHY|nr:hypothetical protein POSPLADRAFT_1139758 [Postia placenta MAD-698-R-SB12]OSX63610.1 hypothetical protein POSPLADRAFT_1139758 [Postia placenta MAD-698-R-SB12]